VGRNKKEEMNPKYGEKWGVRREKEIRTGK
jgi:hypothetical protein